MVFEPPEPNTITIDDPINGNMDREYLLMNPNNSRNVIFAWHGGGGNPLKLWKQSGFLRSITGGAPYAYCFMYGIIYNPTAEQILANVSVPTDESRYVLTARLGGRYHNDGREDSNFSFDDVLYFSTLHALLCTVIPEGEDEPLFDNAFTWGASNGGNMVLKLLSEVPYKVKAGAVVASSFPMSYRPPAPGQKVPIIHHHGSRDPMIDTCGGIGHSNARTNVPHQSFSAFKEANALSGVAHDRKYRLADKDVTDGCIVDVYEWDDPDAPDFVLQAYYDVINGGHTMSVEGQAIFDPRDPLDEDGRPGKYCTDYSAIEKIHDFFTSCLAAPLTRYFAVDAAIGVDAGAEGFETQDDAEASPFATLDYVNSIVDDAFINVVVVNRAQTHIAPAASWAAGTAYRQRFGAYGTGAKPIIDGETARAGLAFVNKARITIEDIEFTNCAVQNGAINVVAGADRGPDGMIVRRCYIHDCDEYGIHFGDPGTSPAPYKVLLEDCLIEDCGKGGWNFVGQHDGSIARRVITRRCNSDTANNTWGGHAQPSIDRPEMTRVSSDGIYEGELDEGLTAADVSYTPSSLGYYILEEGAFDHLEPGEWAQSGTTVQVNLGEDVGATIDAGGQLRIALNVCRNIRFERCETYEQFAEQPSGNDGTGQGMDVFVRNWIIDRPISNDNEGHGVAANCVGKGLGRIIRGSFRANGKFGVNVAKGRQGGETVVQIVQCSIDGNTLGSIQGVDVGTEGLVGAELEMYDNLCDRSVVGFSAEGETATWIDEGNAVFGAGTSGFANAVVAGGDPFTTGAIDGLIYTAVAAGGDSGQGLSDDFLYEYRRDFSDNGGAGAVAVAA